LGGTPARRHIGVLALQGDFREHMAALRACEVEAFPVRLAADMEAADGLILPGGESTTMQHLMEPALRQAIQTRARSGMPVMGTCAGMILMSQRIEGGRSDQAPLGLMDITVRRNAYGRQRESFEADVESEAIDGVGPAVFIRAPRVVHQAREVTTLAELNGHPVAVRQGNRLALAFHPELTPDRRWHHFFLALDGKKQ
jgi:5'-phosphate synthase pdxT subunit